MQRIVTCAFSALALIATSCGVGGDGDADDDNTDIDGPATSSVVMPSCTPAPASTTKVHAHPDWSPGVTRTLLVETIRQDPRPGRSATTETPVTVIALEEFEDGSVDMSWEADDIDFLGSGLSAVEEVLADDVASRLPRTIVRYQLSDERFWLGVHNVDELRAAANETLEVVRPFLEDTVVDQVEQLYATLPDESIELTFAETPMLWHGLDGYRLEVGDLIEADDLLPNTFGGQPFPAITSVRISALVNDAGCVEIEQVTTPETTAFASILVETLGASFDAMPEDVLEEMGMTDFSIVNSVVGAYDLTAERFVRITASQEITVEGETARNTTIITDVTE